MGSGQSGLYYTSHGSHKIHHQAIIHSLEGNYTVEPRSKKISKMINGGHGQQAIDFMLRNGLKFEINKTYPNGVRIGNVFDHKKEPKRRDNNQAWFPKSQVEKKTL